MNLHLCCLAITVVLIGNLNVAACAYSTNENEPESWQGNWTVELETPGGPLPFELRCKRNANEWTTTIHNADETIKVDNRIEGSSLVLDMSHYDSRLTLKLDGEDRDRAKGTWKKTRGADQVAELECLASRGKLSAEVSDQRTTRELEPWLGRFAIRFADSSDIAVGIFEASDSNNTDVRGTILTTTGDYRYLAGQVTDSGELRLSCFDGAHAFLITAKMVDGKLRGDFWSGDWYHTTWQGTRDPDVKLADGFTQAAVNEGVRLSELEYVDLDGKPVSMVAEELSGKVTIVELFGSWCPNCHDAAAFLGELDSRYADQGLKVVGLGFELTGRQERDLRQLKRYVDRFDIEYPVLLAGLADKAKASKAFPVLDRVRSYPTLVIVDQAGKVRTVYSGFSGPATGEEHTRLCERLEGIVRSLLAE